MINGIISKAVQKLILGRLGYVVAYLFGYIMILAGDIGGTNTRLALFEINSRKSLQIVANTHFQSADFANFIPILQTFLKQHNKTPTLACLAIAGPVQNNLCKATNLPWIVDGDELRHLLKIPHVSLLNDLEAKAWSLSILTPDSFYSLHPGNVKQIGNIAIIAAGTGLGEAGLYWDGKTHHPFACEGGHTDFAPRDAQEIDLLLYLKNFYSHVSYERVISGPGLYLLYQFLIKTGREKESSAVRYELEHRDPPSVVSDWGKTNRDAACTRALEWFISLYGAEAGNLALKIMALGGLYISGGIAPRLIEKFQQGHFVQSFLDKGRFHPLLESIPIRIILNDDATLLGAAEFARTQGFGRKTLS